MIYQPRFRHLSQCETEVRNLDMADYYYCYVKGYHILQGVAR